MIEFKKVLIGFLSRKWLLSVGVVVIAYVLPVSFHGLGISDSVIMASLAIVGSITSVYGVVNIKDKAP